MLLPPIPKAPPLARLDRDECSRPQDIVLVFLSARRGAETMLAIRAMRARKARRPLMEKVDQSAPGSVRGGIVAHRQFVGRMRRDGRSSSSRLRLSALV
jgi:hypothetical protein